MAVSRKGKRKIVVNDTVFYWYVKWDEDWWLKNILYILNDDMQHIIHYITGKEHTTIFQTPIQSPIWLESNDLHDPKQVDVITPQIVANIIKWCLENKKDE